MTQNLQRQFRNTLGQFATGVTVITTCDQFGNKVGMTANSFSSVSLDPMLVLWSIDKSASLIEVFNATDYFAVHVLGAGQESISNQFASKNGDRFSGIHTRTGLNGVPLLTEYAAQFQCQIESRYDGGDHIIQLGRVLAFDKKAHPPLVFHAGRYAKLMDTTDYSTEELNA